MGRHPLKTVAIFQPIPAGFFEKFKVAGVVDVLVNVEMISTNFDLCLHSAITLRCCYKYRGHNWYDLFSLAKKLPLCKLITGLIPPDYVPPANCPSPAPALDPPPF